VFTVEVRAQVVSPRYGAYLVKAAQETPSARRAREAREARGRPLLEDYPQENPALATIKILSSSVENPQHEAALSAALTLHLAGTFCEVPDESALPADSRNWKSALLPIDIGATNFVRLNLVVDFVNSPYEVEG
jgi:hypothetical protein